MGKPTSEDAKADAPAAAERAETPAPAACQPSPGKRTASKSTPSRPTPSRTPSSRPHAAVRRATGPRYGKVGARRPLRPAALAAESPATAPVGRNRIHSILTALPVLMLIAGLYYYYSGESAQKNGVPLIEQSVRVSGSFEGLSVVRSGGVGRHYLWFDDGQRRRGARLKARDVPQLASLRPGDRVELSLAPTVDGSTTLWAWRIVQDEDVLLDAGDLPAD